MRKLKRFLPWPAILALLLMALPVSVVSAQDVTVSVDAPAEVAQGSNFTARVNVTEVTDMDAFQLSLTYDPDVIAIIGAEGEWEVGITHGRIEPRNIPVDMWGFNPPGVPGTVSSIGNLGGATGVSGSGYLCEIHFTVVGDPGETSDLTLSAGRLSDGGGEEIPGVEWLGTTVQVVTGASVSIEAPGQADQGSDFTATVNVTEVVNFDSYQFDLSYNSAVIQVIGAEGGVEGVTPGTIDSTAIPIDSWGFIPSGVTGTMRLMGNVPGDAGVTGMGCLAEIHFHVIGSSGESSGMNFSNGLLRDNTEVEIPVTDWLGASVQVTGRPTIDFSPAALNFSAVEGEANPADQILEIWNASDGTVEWTVGDDAAWLNLNPGSGSSTGEKDEVTASVDMSGMSAGDYSATITITAPGVWNSPQTVPVNLHIVSRITVSIDAPDEVGADSDFTARVNVTEVTDFDSFQFDLTYNPDVIQIIGVEGEWEVGITHGRIEPRDIPVELWGFIPPGVPGTVRPLGNLPGVTGVTGAGYLCEVHFTVVGDPGDSSDITLSEGWLGDVNGLEVLVGQWLGTTVQVTLFDAEFSTDSGIAGHTLEGTAGVTEFDFTDATTGGTMPYTYEWDFNNDAVIDSTVANPIYTYPAAGTYTVVLTVTDDALRKNTETKESYITVYAPVDAEFCANSGFPEYPTAGYPGVTAFNFSNESSGGKTPYSCQWDFENDTVTDSTLESPSHIYPAVGNYTVVLTVSDSLLDGDTEAKIEYIIVRQPGDANQDGVVDMGDVTKVERIILGLDAPTLFADANQDGIINMGDVTRIERIILGLD